MLLLSRKESESITIGEDIKITIARIHGAKVTIGIEAPKHLLVLRTPALDELIARSSKTATIVKS